MITAGREKGRDMGLEKNHSVIVLIPAYCPDEKMITLIDRISEKFESVLVVNDGSGESYDALFQQAEEKAVVLSHEVNRGKGCALRTGFSYVQEHYQDAVGVVTIDADGQHTPEDVEKCCEAFLKEPDKVIMGCRNFKEDTKIPARSRFGNRLTSKMMRFFCDITLSDTQTGLRVLPFSVLSEMLKVKGDRYEYEMNSIFRLKELHVEWTEVPIEVIYIDDNESSHFNPIKDSFKIYKVFFKFCISSLGSCLLDMLLFLILSHFIKPVSPVYYIIIATVIARICSGIFNYSINRLVFTSKTNAKESGPRYFIVWLIQMSCSALLVNGAASILPIHEGIIKLVIDTVLFFLSYKIQQKWVFHDRKETSKQ